MQIPFSRIYSDKEEKEAVNRVLESGWWAAGEEVARFEKEFAKYIGAKYFIFTNSCTSALKMSYKYFKELGYKHYYLNEPNTFCATYAAAEEIGLERQYIKQFQQIKVSMHYGGVFQSEPCLIEDSAHRIESNDKWIGKIKCYSFYATKNMSCGSGGGLATNDKEIYERCRLYWRDGLTSSTHDRQTGKSWNYKVKVMAGGYDGNDIAAALGRVQLRRLPDFLKRRNEIRDRYNAAFGTDWQGNHLFPVFVDNEQQVGELIGYLKEKGISSGFHYPNSGWLGVSLPIYPLLTDEEQEYIIKEVLSWRGSTTNK